MKNILALFKILSKIKKKFLNNPFLSTNKIQQIFNMNERKMENLNLCELICDLKAAVTALEWLVF